MFVFQSGDFFYSTAEWMDWLTIAFNVITIVLTYWVAHSIYSKEKKDKIVDENKLIEIEYELFTKNLTLLDRAINKQITALEGYINGTEKYLGFNTLMQIKFLDSVNYINIYKQIGISKTTQIDFINELIANIYSLNDFKDNIRHELKSYNERVNANEGKLYTYRDLLYSNYFKLSNERKTSENKGVYNFSKDDQFMIEYSELIKNVHTSPSIIKDNVLIDRRLFIEEFIRPLAAASIKYILNDLEAIIINTKCNIVNEAYENLLTIEKEHEKMIRDLISQLKNIQKLLKRIIT
jgi:hypothetical protein